MSQRTRSWNSQSSTCRWTCGRELRVTEGGKVLSHRQRKLQALQRQETRGEHDQGQVPMQPIPASSLEVVQATLLFGLFGKLLDHPACMSQSDELCERGLRRQRAEPVLGLRDFLLICDFRHCARSPGDQVL